MVRARVRSFRGRELAAIPSTTAESKLAELKHRLREISDLSSAGAVLGWDQATYMPPGGAAARARQGATLSRLAHEKSTDPALGRLLDAAAALRRQPAARLRRRQPDPRRAPRLREGDQGAGRVRRPLERAQLSLLRGLDPGAPRQRLRRRAPAAGEDARSQPRSTPASSRRYEHIADPLIDGPDDGMTTATVRALFAELRAQLVPIVRAITAQPPADDSCLRQRFPGGARSWRSASTSSSASATTSSAAGRTRRTIPF